MRLSTGLLLPVLIGTASAIPDAKVYIFQGEEFPNTSTPPTLSPEEARLVFAERLGVSEYHRLGDVSESALSHINKFGGPQELLFQDLAYGKATELVLIVEGISSKTAGPLLSAWSSIKPAFMISNPPSSSSNLKFAQELQAQVGTSPICAFEDTINPAERKCWMGQSKVLQIDLASGNPGIEGLMSAQERLIKFVTTKVMNVVVVLMPEACRTIKSPAKPYGSYDTPHAQVQLGRRQEAEEPMAAASSSSASSSSSPTGTNPPKETEPLLPVPATCYASIDSCNARTNNCSGHGDCRKKYGREGGAACFACLCVPTEENFKEGSRGTPSKRAIYWGGAACQKKDVSGPFWLFASFTVVLVGLVAWAIGMLFSIGEEKLPGVIGAGVSSKAR